MKILITGAGGMVGQNISEKLNLSSYDLLTPKKNELNLLNKKNLQEYLEQNKPEFIIHAAGIVGGILFNIDNQARSLHENIVISTNLLECAIANNIKKILNISSSCIYPKNIQNPIREADLLKAELEPTNEGYAIAKIAMLKLCEYYSEIQDISFKTIIPCNLYGKYDKFNQEYSHMIPSVIMKIHKALINNESTVSIWGDGTSRREFMYVEDLANFILFAIKNFSKLPQNLNVGTGKDFTINEYYREIARVIGFKGEFTHDYSKPSGMKQKLVDISYLKKLGWSSTFNLNDGLKNTYEYYLNLNKDEKL